MKENPANAIKDTMRKFLMDKGQKVAEMGKYEIDI